MPYTLQIYHLTTIELLDFLDTYDQIAVYLNNLQYDFILYYETQCELEYESKKYASNLKYIWESQSITMSDAIKLDKKISVVYVISDCDNNIVYVGQTDNFSARMKSHVYDDKGLAKKID